MTLRFNLTGKARTKLAKAISQELNTEATYIKGRTHAYIIGDYTLDKEGILTGPDNWELTANLQGLHGFVPASADYTTDEEIEAPAAFEEAEETIADLPEPPLVHPPSPLETLEEPADTEPKLRTYKAELSTSDAPDHMEIFFEENDFEAVKAAYDFCTEGVTLQELHELDRDYNEIRHIDLEASKPRLTIIMPTEGFTPEKLDNLCKMVTAKEPLLKAALGVEQLPVQFTEEGIKFPWFWSAESITPEEHEAYATLISLLCETAKEKKRVTAKAGEMPENPKFAFRCWLISLGMIGAEYKTSRKILLSKLQGCSAWKNGSPQPAASIELVAPATECAADIKTPA